MVLLFSDLTPAVIPGIPVNIPTFPDVFFFAALFPLVADRTPHLLRAGRVLPLGGLPQQVRPVRDDGSAGVRCGLTAVNRCSNPRISARNRRRQRPVGTRSIRQDSTSSVGLFIFYFLFSPDFFLPFFFFLRNGAVGRSFLAVVRMVKTLPRWMLTAEAMPSSR